MRNIFKLFRHQDELDKRLSQLENVIVKLADSVAKVEQESDIREMQDEKPSAEFEKKIRNADGLYDYQRYKRMYGRSYTQTADRREDDDT